MTNEQIINEYYKIVEKVNNFSEAKVNHNVKFEIVYSGNPAQYNWQNRTININVNDIYNEYHLKSMLSHELRHAQQHIMLDNYKNNIVLGDVHNDVEKWINNIEMDNYISDTNVLSYYTQPLEFDAYAFTEMIFILDNEQQYNRQFVQPEFVDYKKSLINLAKQMIQTYKTIK